MIPPVEQPLQIRQGMTAGVIVGIFLMSFLGIVMRYSVVEMLAAASCVGLVLVLSYGVAASISRRRG